MVLVIDFRDGHSGHVRDRVGYLSRMGRRGSDTVGKYRAEVCSAGSCCGWASNVMLRLMTGFGRGCYSSFAIDAVLSTFPKAAGDGFKLDALNSTFVDVRATTYSICHLTLSQRVAL